jgi:hypothetical protein
MTNPPYRSDSWGPLPYPFKDMLRTLSLFIGDSPAPISATLDIERHPNQEDLFSTTLILEPNFRGATVLQARVRLSADFQTAIKKDESPGALNPFQLYVPPEFNWGWADVPVVHY